MINIKKLTENLHNMYPDRKTILEDSFNDLARTVDDGRKGRASALPAYYQSIDQAKDGNARTHWEVPSQSGNGKYQQVVQIHVPVQGGLFTVAQGKWQPKVFAEALSKSDVRVHCSCPDFYWSGMKYNLGPAGVHKGSLAPNQPMVKGETTPVPPPDARDPDRKHTICKHLYSIFQVFPNNALKIMGDARKYSKENEVIEIDDKITRDGDQGRATLEKDIDTVGVTEGDTSIVTDSLLKAAEVLDQQKDEGSEDIIDDRNEEIIDQTEDSVEQEEVIDERPEDIPDEVEEVKERGAEEIIDDKNEVSVEYNESDVQVEEIIEPIDGPEEEESKDGPSASDILGR